MGIDFYNESTDLVKNNQNNDLKDKKLTNLDSVVVNRDPSSDNELSRKNYIDNELDKNATLRFNQTLQIYLKVSLGNDTYNFTKNNKILLTDVLEIKVPNKDNDLLPNGKSKK